MGLFSYLTLYFFQSKRMQAVQVRYLNGIRDDYLAKEVKANLKVDTPLQSLFRMVDFALAGRHLSMRDEVEYFWRRAVPTNIYCSSEKKSSKYNLHYERDRDKKWLICNLPDPRELKELPPPLCQPVFMLKGPYPSGSISQYIEQNVKYANFYASKEGCKQLRIALVAAFAAELCEAFNCRIEVGAARGRADSDDRFNFATASKGTLQLETPPTWEQEIGKLPVEGLGGCLRFYGLEPRENGVVRRSRGFEARGIDVGERFIHFA